MFQQLDLVLSIIFFFLGSIIGSFLNVVILRFRSGRGLSGRSMCFSCGKTLTPFELVPIGSFLTQKGRCLGCKTRISWQYPVVEAVTGIVFSLLYSHFNYLFFSTPLLFAVLFIFYAVVFSILIVLSVYDIKHKILPNKLVVIFASIAFIGMFFISGDSIALHVPNYLNILSGLILPAPFYFLWLISKGKWMGLGDSKLMVGIGLFLGLSSGAVAILFSFWIGAIVGIVLLIVSRIWGKKNLSMKTSIPFGPFLALGTIIVFLCNLDMPAIFKIIGN